MRTMRISLVMLALVGAIFGTGMAFTAEPPPLWEALLPQNPGDFFEPLDIVADDSVVIVSGTTWQNEIKLVTLFAFQGSSGQMLWRSDFTVDGSDFGPTLYMVPGKNLVQVVFRYLIWDGQDFIPTYTLRRHNSKTGELLWEINRLFNLANIEETGFPGNRNVAVTKEQTFVLKGVGSNMVPAVVAYANK